MGRIEHLLDRLAEAEKQRADAQAFYEGQSDKTASLQESLAEAERECDELRAKLADWQETYARIVAERCAPDEHHCTCVPALRAEIAWLETAREKATMHLVRASKLDAALQFYAGRKREDGNGYEFDDEPSRIIGGVARAALKGGA